MTGGVPLWVKILAALWLALAAGCTVAVLIPAEAHAQAPPLGATTDERRHQELVAALAGRAPQNGGPQTQTGTVIVVVAALQLLQSLGIIGWAKWSVAQIAKDEATRVADELRGAITAHDASPYAHVVASEHNHRGLIAKIEEAEGEIRKVDAKVGRVDGLVRRLLVEHSLIHKLQLNRDADIRPEDADSFPDAPTGGGRK